MTIDEIKTFLSIIETGTISASAQQLFVSQSTVSHRIQLLEEELNITLFIRNKGQRSVLLTPAGENFIPIAHQWLSLWKDTQSLQADSFKQCISIGSVDLINKYTFVPLYKRLIAEHPELSLYICTHHSGEIHSLLSNHLIDIGFVFSRVNYPNIISKPVYRELMYLVCNKENNYHNEITPIELNQNNEVYLNWGNDFQIWHNTYWPNKQYSIRVNTGSMVADYLTDAPNRWSVVPMSLVKVLMQNPNIVSYTLKSPPPPRICYQITHRFPKPSVEHLIQTCLKEADTFIQQSQSICTFEPWMMENI